MAKDYKTEGPWRFDATDDNRSWASNAVRYDSKEEAETAARELGSRWFGMKGYRVVPSDTPQHEQVDYEAHAEAGQICRSYV